MARMKLLPKKNKRVIPVLIGIGMVFCFFIPLIIGGVWWCVTKSVGPALVRSEERYGADFAGAFAPLMEDDEFEFVSCVRVRTPGGRWATAKFDSYSELSDGKLRQRLLYLLVPAGWTRADAEDFRFKNWPGLDAGPKPGPADTFMKIGVCKDGVTTRPLTARFRLNADRDTLMIYSALEK